MKNKKSISAMLATMLMLVVCFTTSNSFAQMKNESNSMKNGCMMQNGKMMQDGYMMQDGKMMKMKGGKTMPMDKEMTMNNGTKVMLNGDCIMKDGTKMMMKDGDCMDMSGKMDKCTMKDKDGKSTPAKK